MFISKSYLFLSKIYLLNKNLSAFVILRKKKNFDIHFFILRNFNNNNKKMRKITN